MKFEIEGTSRRIRFVLGDGCVYGQVSLHILPERRWKFRYHDRWTTLTYEQNDKLLKFVDKQLTLLNI
jgi:hypothetical protein